MRKITIKKYQVFIFVKEGTTAIWKKNKKSRQFILFVTYLAWKSEKDIAKSVA